MCAFQNGHRPPPRVACPHENTSRVAIVQSLNQSLAIFKVAQIVELLRSPRERVRWKQKCHNKMWGKDLWKRNVLSRWRKVGKESDDNVKWQGVPENRCCKSFYLYTVKLRTSDYELPSVKYYFNKQNFNVRSLFHYVQFCLVLMSMCSFLV